MKTRDQIIYSMCMTYDHRWGLPTYEEELEKSGPTPFGTIMYLTQSEKRHIHNLMSQIFTNDIEPYMIMKG